MITSLSGARASRLGLAAHPEQDPRCVARAFRCGINYFFFYGPGHTEFLRGLVPVLRRDREQVIVASGSGSRQRRGLLGARRRILTAAGVDMLDAFFAEYLTASDDLPAVFGEQGLLDELQQWKAEGWIRYVGATTHDRAIARRLTRDPRVDLLMHRYNMAHRKAAREVFPAAIRTGTPVVAFTATRWGTLLEPHAGWSGRLPSSVDCYRYCLAHPAVHVVLTAPRSLGELDQNLEVLGSPPLRQHDRSRWERFGDVVHARGQGAFETRWP